MKKIYIIITLTLSIIISQDFNPGPYGKEYFDIAGPFHLIDLNNDQKLLGDLNQDSILNISDVIIVVGIILETLDLEENEYIADLNQDNTVDILDVLLLIERILYPNSYIPENCWDFESQWNGEENYMFIHYDPSNNNSVNMWDDDCPGNICPNGSDRIT